MEASGRVFYSYELLAAFLAVDLDPESIAFEMLFSGAPESRFPRKIGADAWFDFRNAEHFEIQEQSFLLPNEEVLTLLILPDEALE